MTNTASSTTSPTSAPKAQATSTAPVKTATQAAPTTTPKAPAISTAPVKTAHQAAPVPASKPANKTSAPSPSIPKVETAASAQIDSTVTKKTQQSESEKLIEKRMKEAEQNAGAAGKKVDDDLVVTEAPSKTDEQKKMEKSLMNKAVNFL